MQQNRTRHSAEFKAQVALATLSESKTLIELAVEYRVYPTQDVSLTATLSNIRKTRWVIVFGAD